MSSVNSKYRLDLPVAPGAQKDASLFNELLAMYSGLRIIHGTLAGLFDVSARTQEEHAAAEAEDKYLINGITKVIVQAGEAILAGRFLELYYSGGWKIKHTNITGSYLYAGVLGLSLENRAAGEYAEVITSPAILSGFSGLVPGQQYYAYTNGQFVDVPGVPRPGGSGNVDLIPCGVAVSPTKLRLISIF